MPHKDLEKRRAYHRAWCKRNRAKVNGYKPKASETKRYQAILRTNRLSIRRVKLRKLGLTLDDFDALLKRQRHRCAICCTNNPNKGNWCLDHDHRTGKLRGLLCHNCNASLGLLKDSRQTIKRMLNYLS
jgi:hypothetical protein